ncbi:MAG TPA: hypothetical protein VFS43_31705 [Polyangiaceae bacterium]|nr:hypothetical protein [Polyangiaceae bacterium]
MAETLDVAELVKKNALKPAGTTANTEYYALDDDILVAIPFEGSKDDGATARGNRDHQTNYFRDRGQKGGIIIFFDRMKSQDREARMIYTDMDRALTATALVGGSMLGRAMASFLMGIARPKVPIRLFPTFEAALEWVREMNRTADRTLAP